MRDWSDKQLDAEIRAGLAVYRAVPPRRKAEAWAALRERAARQSVLPALPPAESRSAASLPRRALERVAAVFAMLVTDSDPFERALEQRTALWQADWLHVRSPRYRYAA
jgi:hypothetical protein